MKAKISVIIAMLVVLFLMSVSTAAQAGDVDVVTPIYSPIATPVHQAHIVTPTAHKPAMIWLDWR